MKRLLALTLVASIGFLPQARGQDKKMLRAGIIGLDTSHVPAFTKLFNEAKPDSELAGIKVIAGFPAGSPDVESSRTRVKMFTEQIRDKWGVEIVNSIDELVAKVDVVMIESVDGRPHLSQVTPVLKAGKLVFIDKPIAGSLADALMIFELSKQYKTPLWSSSSLRYYPGVQSVKKNEKVGNIVG